MTLRDLVLLVRHYAKWVIAFSIICALAAGGFAFVRGSQSAESYTATSVLTISDPTGTLNATNLINLAGSVAQEVAGSQAAGHVSAKSDSLSQTVTFNASDSTAEGAIELANSTADQTVEGIMGIFAEQREVYLDAADAINDPSSIAGSASMFFGSTLADKAAALQSCALIVSKATSASGGASGGVSKYVIVGFLGGLFIAVCALALLDTLRRPVKGPEDLSVITDLPLLACSKEGLLGERLWANVRFSAGDGIASICLIPVSKGDECEAVLQRLVQSASSDYPQSKGVVAQQVTDTVSLNCVDPLFAILCDPLNSSIKGAYLANCASATVVLVRQWADNVFAVADSLRELRLAKANIVGVVLL